LILIAVTYVLMTTEITGKTAKQFGGLLILNTTVAIQIGQGVANALQPGTWSKVEQPALVDVDEQAGPVSPVELIAKNVPKSIPGPPGDKQNIIGVIIIAVAVGLALRTIRDQPIKNVQDAVESAYSVLLKVLSWIIGVVQIGVMQIVAKVVGTAGFGPFKALSAFIVAVLLPSFEPC